MFPVIQFAGLSIQTSGLILLGGLWIALTVVERYAPPLGADPEEISNLTFYSLIGAILGARLAYALRFPSTFAEHPANLLSLNPGLLDPLGATLVALVVALIYGQRKNMNLLSTLDALSPGLALLGLAVGLSQLASGSAFGLPSELPWAIELWGASRHPTQVYTILAFGLIFWLLVYRLVPAKREKGTVFLAFVALSAFARLFLDAFRGDDLPLIFGLRNTQVVAWFILAASLWLARKLLLQEPQKA